MQQKTNNLFEFGGFRLDCAERRLLFDQQLISLPPKAFDLLVLFLQNPNRLLEKSELLSTLWPDTFVEESNLSVHISTLRRALAGEDGECHWIETVPKRGYRFVGEVTATAEFRSVDAPEPQTETAPAVAPERPIAPTATPQSKRPGPSAVLAVLLLLLLALAAVFWWRMVDRPTRSVAVLPFLPVSDTEDQKYVGMGISDAVITRLSAQRLLDVRPTSLVAGIQGLERDVLEAGKRLGVDAVIDGRIQLQGARIRVTAQMIRSKDGRQLWAGTFDEKLADIFLLEDHIAESLIGTLAGSNAPARTAIPVKRSTQNAEAYRLYLQGQYLASKRLNAATRNAIAAFEQAIAMDPAYPEPYAALSHSYLIRSGEGWGQELREKAKTYALRAMSLDDQLAESQLALGQVLMRAEWDWAGAERAFQRAIERNPNLAFAHASLSTLHTAFGRHEDAIREIRIACSLDPTAATWQADLAWTLTFAKRFPEAIAEGQKAIALDAWSYSARRQTGKALLLHGQYNESVAEMRQAFEINGGRKRRVLAELANSQLRAGQTAEATKAIESVLTGTWEEPVPYYELAVYESSLGHPAQALRHLEQAIQERITRVIWMREDPELQSLHAQSGFKALLERLGLPR